MMPDLSSFMQQGEEISSLIRQLNSGKMVHASLITGEKGIGKRTLAKLIAAALLCRSDGDRPCGRCKDCLAAIQGDHPDLIIIQKGLPIASDIKKDRSTIPVDDIREMIRLCSTHTFDGRARVILLLDAEKMTPQAQNCLLKTLEEPPENTYLLLVTDHPDALLTTVVSRTRTIRLHAWPDAYVRSILDARGIDPARASASVSEARGSIGKAIALASDEEYWSLRNEITGSFFGTLNRGEILSISSAWKDRKDESDRLFEIIESLIRNLMEARFYPDRNERISVFSASWQNFSLNAGTERFTLILDAISDARRQIRFNVNFQAVIEHFLFILMGEGNLWSV